MSVTDVGVAKTNLRVVCKIITCASAFTEMVFLEIAKAAASRGVAGYAKDAIVSACYRTSDRQEHKTIWHAGPERDMIFHLRVTACREHARQPLSRQAISLGSFTVAADFVLQLIHLESLGSELQPREQTTFILLLM